MARTPPTSAQNPPHGPRAGAGRRRRLPAPDVSPRAAANRVMGELGRFGERAGDLRSRAERVVDRVKRLV